MATRNTAVMEKKGVAAKTTCRHYWIIETPTGPTSRGTCRTCGAEKEFKNYIETTPWGEDAPVLEATIGHRLPVEADLPELEEAEV